MRSKPSHPRVYKDALFLSICEPSELKEWFKLRETKLSAVNGEVETKEEAHLLEYIIFRRNDPALDLLLATYGTSATVLRRLYHRGGTAIKVSVCSNSATFCGDTIGNMFFNERHPYFYRDILERGSMAELQALCLCQNLSNDAYSTLIESWIGYPDSTIEKKLRISDERFLRVLEFLSQNKRISQRREDTDQRHYWDGFSEYEYNKFFDQLWGLAEIVPIKEEWAYFLHKIYEKLVIPYKQYEDIDALLTRWSGIECKAFDGPGLLRTTLAKKFKVLGIADLENDDPAIRRAVYLSFDPDHEDFRNKDYFEWHQKDKNSCFDIFNNVAVLKSARGRAKFRSMLWKISDDDHDLILLGRWNEKVENAEVSNPEWFVDENFDDELVDEFEDAEEVDHNIADDLNSINVDEIKKRPRTSIYLTIILIVILYLIFF